jgi:hypothetical protein
MVKELKRYKAEGADMGFYYTHVPGMHGLPATQILKYQQHYERFTTGLNGILPWSARGAGRCS